MFFSSAFFNHSQLYIKLAASDLLLKALVLSSIGFLLDAMSHSAQWQCSFSLTGI